MVAKAVNYMDTPQIDTELFPRCCWVCGSFWSASPICRISVRGPDVLPRRVFMIMDVIMSRLGKESQ